MASTVTVACKMPQGLVLKVKGDARSFVLNGQNKTRMTDKRGLPLAESVGITEIPKDFWEAWSTEYAKYAPLVKGLIFVQSSEKAAEKAAEKNTAEPTNAKVKQTNKLKED